MSIESRGWPDFRVFDPASFVAPTRKVTKVYLHCTASDNKNLVGRLLAEEVDRWHLQNGWTGIGYHYVIDKEGTIITARPTEIQPAAQLGKDNLGNVATLAFSTHGNWEFTEKSLESVIALCKAIDYEYKRRNTPVTFHGHCEIDPRPCPVFDYKALLGLDLLGNLFNNGCDSASVVAQRATKITKQ